MNRLDIQHRNQQSIRSGKNQDVSSFLAVSPPLMPADQKTNDGQYLQRVETQKMRGPQVSAAGTPIHNRKSRASILHANRMRSVSDHHAPDSGSGKENSEP